MFLSSCHLLFLDLFFQHSCEGPSRISPSPRGNLQSMKHKYIQFSASKNSSTGRTVARGSVFFKRRVPKLQNSFPSKLEMESWAPLFLKKNANKLSSVFLVVPCPIHWLNAYANASAHLRGLERVPTPEVFDTRCLRGCLRGVLCWMAMLW